MPTLDTGNTGSTLAQEDQPGLGLDGNVRLGCSGKPLACSRGVCVVGEGSSRPQDTTADC